MTAHRSFEAAATVRVRIPSPLRSYTRGKPDVMVAIPVLAPELPPTLAGVLAAVDSQYRGLRFRIVDEQGQVRPHIKLFVGTIATRDLATPVPAGQEVMIVAALSGG
ncbi:MAG TPA: MoaD/ThiS family protein [Casimicrobiaceae bacterium]|jgi:molybdopterin converting factor small subunit|nr:MoaD/ThiS family protein [Casimicrobiaceae bacterium]